MNDNLTGFGNTAKGLAKNPLGIIALFIVLVYGFAALVTTFSGSMSQPERLPLIWFLVVFPILVLGVFAWLVSRHGGKLYGPGDYRDEENYIRMQLRQLETRVSAVGPESTLRIEQRGIAAAIEAPHSDARLAVAQMRLDIEKELFLLSRFTTRTPSDTVGWPIHRHIEELEKVEAIEPGLASNIRDFVAIANSIVHDPVFVEKDARSAATVGSSLVAMLHHKRLVASLEYDLESNGLWHMCPCRPEGETQYDFWSAVASALPEFEYDFDVYQESSRRYVERTRVEHPKMAERFHILSLDEFVAVLEFRERELQRIIPTWQSKDWTNSHNLEWQWPAEWGEIHWNGPILRERAYLWGAEEDLMLTRAALDFYRPRLLALRNQ
jgi:hypothetical protein